MRIGIDGRELAGNRTGVGRYLAGLCERWSVDPAAAAHDLVIYTPASIAPVTAAADTTPPGARIEQTVVPGDGGVWWEQVTLANAARNDRLDVFFGPGYSVPLRLGVPRVVTLHDVSFTAHPEWFGWREGTRRRWLARRSAEVARLIVTVSEFARSEILRYFDVDPRRVRVVHNGICAPRRGAPTDRRPLVLYVGSLFNRRHLPTLIAAFGQVARHVADAELVIVGADRTYPRQDLAALAAATGVGSRVSFEPYVDDAALAALYARARVFAYLSEYEGFGMTPLEAVAAGVPPVVGDTPAAREVYADAARYVPFDDPDAVGRALLEVMRDPAVRQTLLERGRPLLDRFTWAQAASSTLPLLEQAAESLR